ncbi:alpha/beta-hydrolase [Rhizoctonia solani 123E]|uniref:Alpha/beta-hydrolase n=1 Tax=Rhizoctonia solani 123E TaxID=1423351 RepID=A0A074RWI8_9AGAM|nr:alpha/beta-hydrolase [Rhizoctonia solani 123E]
MSEKPPHLPSPGHSRSRRLWACVALTLLAYHVYKHVSIDVRPLPSSTVSGITWWPCPDVTTTECAYLTVPRDYTNPEANDTVSIFMRKVPATVSRKEYLGSILVNPGGPGGSGSGLAAWLGPSFSTLVEGRYDIIGFDPRGVNMTTPKLGCFDNEAQAFHATYKQTLLGVPYDSRGSSTLPPETRARMEHAYLTKLNASFAATSLACLENGNQAILESVGATYVAQDMERIVDALGEDGLNFWGFSYGTILGSTFAAMRPHLVKRMVLDGVCSVESFYNDIYQWCSDELVDNHKALQGFFDSCAEAGPERCAFARSPAGRVSTGGAELRSRFETLSSKLRDEPIPVPRSLTGPGILTASGLERVIFEGLYSPDTWPGVAKAIAEAEAGNPQALYNREYGRYEVLKPSKGEENVFNRYMEHQFSEVITTAIGCSDSQKSDHKSLDEYAEYIHKAGKLAPFSEMWASRWTGFCSNWKIRPGQRYDGPWTVEDGLKKTRFPILYTSLDADPVTPLSAAQKMAGSFGNESAVLLVQEGFGHCTSSHPSLCTAKAVRDYFLKGKVPEPGAVCKPE